MTHFPFIFLFTFPEAQKLGKILLSGKCPFVRTKKLSGKTLYGQKNCPEKKIIQTKKLSGQKKLLRHTFFVRVVNALCFLSLLFFVHPALDLLSWIIVVHIFVRYFNKSMVLISELFYNFFGIITTCLTKQTFHSNFHLLKYGRVCVLKVIQHRLTQWPNELLNNEGVHGIATANTGQLI